ncbi:MAG TPA: protein translocase subunit SecD [Candidatus Pacearchaeota archaeon]|nr:protein translocase subunit SecD [Candidatus Pacearchaeota archaeon]
MSKKKTYLTLFFILILTILSVYFNFPEYFNKYQPIEKLRMPEIPFKLGLDLQGGTQLIYEADLTNIEEKDRGTTMDGLKDIIERRVNLFGVQEPVVQVQQSSNNTYKLLVELPGVKDISEAIEMIGQTPFLEFREERDAKETEEIINKQKELQEKIKTNNLSLEDIENQQILYTDPYFKSTNLTGKYLKKAELVFDQNTQKPMILLHFTDEGSRVFAELTEKNVGKKLAIYVDGNILSAPVVQEKISGGNAQITGEFTIKEAQELVRNLNAGALPVPIKLASQQTIGPTLGMLSLKQSLKAGIYGFVAIILFMIILFRLPGFLSSLSLGIYVSLVLSVFKTVPVTLTLAGIGGFILSMGMAVDANVLIFCRLREELKQGKDFRVALEEAFRRSWPAIRDGNLTTLIVALILFFLGTSFIKGFALTLMIGIIFSLFTNIFITKNLLRIFVGTRFEKIKWIW